jgi:hypothetical protein
MHNHVLNDYLWARLRHWPGGPAVLAGCNPRVCVVWLASELGSARAKVALQPGSQKTKAGSVFLELGCSWCKPAARGCSQETKLASSMCGKHRLTWARFIWYKYTNKIRCTSWDRLKLAWFTRAGRAGRIHVANTPFTALEGGSTWSPARFLLSWKRRPRTWQRFDTCYPPGPTT